MNAAVEEETSGISEGKYKVDIDAGTIAVIADHFQKVLDAVDAGCTKTVFCKKLRILEAHYGKKIIISNRNGSGLGLMIQTTGGIISSGLLRVFGGQTDEYL